MMMAHELEMTKGEYVFYTMEMLPEENVLNPEDVWASNDGLNTIAKQAFEAVFHVWHSFFRSRTYVTTVSDLLYICVCENNHYNET